MPRSKTLLEIQKFGGASLADPAAIRQAVEIIRGRPLPSVVVVSAMAGVTDLLLRTAARAGAGDYPGAAVLATECRDRHLAAIRTLLTGRARDELLELVNAEFEELTALCQGLSVVRELTPRTTDFVVGRGERLSAQLLGAVLAAAGVKIRQVDALEVVHTDGHFGGAAPDLEACDRAMQRVLKPLLAEGITPVLPGYVGAGPDGQMTTLGRGGSDLTAVLAGRALGASRVNLWKDVPGLLTANPRVVPTARVLPQLNVREAAELAYYGAKVLHPRALIPVLDRPVPVFVRPFADPQAEGTEVSSRETGLEVPVKALSAATGQALVTVEGNGMLGVPGVAARTFQALHRERISVSLITQASSEHSICFSVPAGSAAQAKACLEAAFQEEINRKEIDGVTVRSGVATIAVVGLGMAGTPGVAQRLFTALASRRINVIAIAQGSSELNISAVVDESQAELAQVAVHEAFQLGKVGGGSVTPRDTLDLVLLGFGKIGRAFADLVAKLPGSGPKVRIVAVMDRSGVVFEPEGLSGRRLLDIAREKERGHALRHMPGGRAASADSAVTMVAGHALSHPVLVDVTAEDTLPLIRSALIHGMDVVLANKRPLSGPAAQAEELWKLAREHGRRLRHEATVGAGLPVMDTIAKLQETGDQILSIEGCLSGTLGFVLSELERGRTFSQAVAAALQAGYSEPDPRDDLSGQDVARKALILGRLIGFAGEASAVAVESLVPKPARSLPLKRWLAQLPKSDAEWAARQKAARSRGAALRYLATVTPQRIKVGLVPVPAESPFAGLRGTDNLIVFTTQRYHDHPLAIRGPGAGPEVTAAGVLNDVLALAHR